MTRELSKEEAQPYAMMLLAGMPSEAVAPMFLEAEADEEEVREAAVAFAGQYAVRMAVMEITGGVPWHKLTPERRLALALDKHYAEMEYFLWSHNYAELQGAEKAKADTCRQALEAKAAGTAGQQNALTAFYSAYADEMKSRRTKVIEKGIGSA